MSLKHWGLRLVGKRMNRVGWYLVSHRINVLKNKLDKCHMQIRQGLVESYVEITFLALKALNQTSIYGNL